MRPYNDIDVYVEDKTYVGVYERIINRVLEGKARVTKVIALGPRKIVEEQASNDNATGGRPRLYIVDSDLDLIARGRMQTPKRLHRLRVYCLENLLFEQNALDAYCSFCCPSKSAAAAIASINFSDLATNVNETGYLYAVALAVARRLDIRHPDFSFDFKAISTKKGAHYIGVDEEKIRRKIYTMIKTIKNLKGVERYRREKSAIMKIIRRRKLYGISYFPGKTLVWYLNQRTAHAKGNALTQQTIVSYLADNCSLKLDKELARRLRKLAGL